MADRVDLVLDCVRLVRPLCTDAGVLVGVVISWLMGEELSAIVVVVVVAVVAVKCPKVRAKRPGSEYHRYPGLIPQGPMT